MPRFATRNIDSIEYNIRKELVKRFIKDYNTLCEKYSIHFTGDGMLGLLINTNDENQNYGELSEFAYGEYEDMEFGLSE